MKKYINAFLYWFFPQSGEIACLKAVVRKQYDLIQTIRANRQTIINENNKLWEYLHKIEAERDKARHMVAVLTAKQEVEQ